MCRCFVGFGVCSVGMSVLCVCVYSVGISVVYCLGTDVYVCGIYSILCVRVCVVWV